ncbi:MAG: hypothetical protein KAI89_06160 [Emcibacter sp.]|nr:hypothetical protein [Emcibacter sp.]
MTEEVPKTSGFLKFIVIFMGILIVLGLTVVVWKVIDLAKQRAARLEMEAAQTEVPLVPEQVISEAFAFDVTLESGEVILETSAASGGIWFRIGRDGKTSRIIYKDFTGKTIGRIEVKRNNEDIMPVN